MATMTRYDEIIEVATRLFAENGYHGVGMRAIADEVNIRSASLYYHFASKADLLEAIVARATVTFIQDNLPELTRDGDAVEQLRGVLIRHISYFWEHRLEQRVTLRELNELSTEKYEEVRQIRRAYQQGIADTIRRGEAQGTMSVASPELAALATLSMINGINDWFSDGGDLRIEQVAELYADMILDGTLRASLA